VTSAGTTVPTGADTGDIYVNTNTGTIFFWDGDTWELTSTDNQQLTGFSFDGVTNSLSLTLENGGTVNVDLSSLSNTLTDINTTLTTFEIDDTNSHLVITDSEGNAFSIALADIAALIDTKLTQAEVASAVNNQFQNLDIDATDHFDGGRTSLHIVPADCADGVDNVDDADSFPLNEIQEIASTDATVALTKTGNNYALSGFDGEWTTLLNVPADFADGVDN